MIVLSVVFEAITVHGPKFITGTEMWFSLKESQDSTGSGTNWTFAFASAMQFWRQLDKLSYRFLSRFMREAW